MGFLEKKYRFDRSLKYLVYVVKTSNSCCFYRPFSARRAQVETEAAAAAAHAAISSRTEIWQV